MKALSVEAPNLHSVIVFNKCVFPGAYNVSNNNLLTTKLFDLVTRTGFQEHHESVITKMRVRSRARVRGRVSLTYNCRPRLDLHVHRVT